MECSNRSQQLAAMPERRYAKLLQILLRQARKNRLVYFILAKRGLVLPEAQAPQPDHDVHDRRPQSGGRSSSAEAEKVSRTDWIMVSQRFAKTAALISPMAVFIGDCEDTGATSKS